MLGPKVPVMRSEAYRKAVASLCCVHCGIEGASQAAHPNSYGSGKGARLKAPDDLCFPLCHVGANGCHQAFDNYELCTAEEMPAVEKRWISWTQTALMNDGSRSTRAALRKVGLIA